MKKLLSLFFISAVLLSFSFIQVDKGKQPGEWEVLGTKVVNFEADHDEIVVTAFEGAFTKIKFKVFDAPIYVKNFRVFFGNGTSENFVIDKRFEAGHESRVIDLIGNKRIIKKININYKTIRSGDGRAKVTVFGKH